MPAGFILILLWDQNTLAWGRQIKSQMRVFIITPHHKIAGTDLTLQACTHSVRTVLNNSL